MKTLGALVVDDEPTARDLLGGLLKSAPGVELRGTCRNGEEALAWLGDHNADLLFLDIQMPGLDGFEVVDRLDPEHSPAVIFVTAYDEFAIRAFEVGAWDYLLKPYDSERLDQCLQRVRQRLRAARSETSSDPSAKSESTQPDFEALLAQLSQKQAPLERLAVPHGRAKVTLRLADVRWIEAESNYVRFHLPRQSYLARISLTRLLTRLDPQRFVRVHRSAIVNTHHIQRLEPCGHGDLHLTLDHGHELTLSRRYRQRLEAVIEMLS